MWSGITSFLFGSEKPEAGANDDGEIASLLLLPADEEGWVLVEECDKLLARESPSATSETERKDVIVLVSDRTLTARPGVRLTSVHLGQKSPSSLPAASRSQACPRDARAPAVAKRLTRNALGHSNKVYHYQSKSKKQRCYNYVLCYSSKSERKC